MSGRHPNLAQVNICVYGTRTRVWPKLISQSLGPTQVSRYSATLRGQGQAQGSSPKLPNRSLASFLLFLPFLLWSRPSKGSTNFRDQVTTAGQDERFPVTSTPAGSWSGGATGETEARKRRSGHCWERAQVGRTRGRCLLGHVLVSAEFWETAPALREELRGHQRGPSEGP